MWQRQTKKREDGLYEDIDEGVVSNCSSKLGPYEDIEDELGIDLRLLHKILTQTIYFIEEHPEYSEEYVKENGKVYFVNKGNVEQSIVQDCGEFFLRLRWLQGLKGIQEKMFPLNEYGKTWALTKEELLWAKN